MKFKFRSLGLTVLVAASLLLSACTTPDKVLVAMYGVEAAAVATRAWRARGGLAVMSWQPLDMGCCGSCGAFGWLYSPVGRPEAVRCSRCATREHNEAALMGVS